MGWVRTDSLLAPMVNMSTEIVVLEQPVKQRLTVWCIADGRETKLKTAIRLIRIDRGKYSGHAA